MNVNELRAALADLPGDMPVLGLYDARCAEAEDIAVHVTQGQCVIEFDGDDTPLELDPETGSVLS